MKWIACVVMLSARAGSEAAARPADPGAGWAGLGAVLIRIETSGEGARLTVEDRQDGWRWESEPLGEETVPPVEGSVAPYELADLTGDGFPEILVATPGFPSGGQLYVFEYRPARREFAPISWEIGPGLGKRDFLAWDIDTPGPAPVQVVGEARLALMSRHFDIGSEPTLFRYEYCFQAGAFRLSGMDLLSPAGS